MLAARKPPSGAVVKKFLAARSDSFGYAYAHRIIHTVCCLAGASSFVDDARNELVNNGVLNAIEAYNTPVLFDWMVRAFSFQGIADLHIPFLDQIAPGSGDQRAIGLKGMLNLNARICEPLNERKHPIVVADRQHHRFAGMPYHRDIVLNRGELEYPLKKLFGQFQGQPFRAGSMRKVTIGTINIAKRRGLNNQQANSDRCTAANSIPIRSPCRQSRGAPATPSGQALRRS
jgi:hypothetical protein